MMHLHLMMVFALVRLTTQSMDLSQTAMEKALKIVPTDPQQLQLILTDAANTFSSLTPAQGLQPPIFPPIASLWQIINEIPSSAPTLTVIPTPSDPSTSTEVPEPVPSSTPAFRLPVSTRPPGVPHHKSTDGLIDKVYKFLNEHETYELRYTNRFKPAENPPNTPEINDASELKTLTSPLIHESDIVIDSRSAFSDISAEVDESDFLSLPELPAKPFSTIFTD